jgi:hypothetical protein
MNLNTLTRSRREPPSPPAGGAGAVIGTAIRGRWRLAFVYDGHPRVIDPHVYGVLSNGSLVLSGCQVGGSSRSGKLPQWKHFELERIEQLDILEESSRIRADYNPDDPRFAKVYAQV